MVTKHLTAAGGLVHTYSRGAGAYVRTIQYIHNRPAANKRPGDSYVENVVQSRIK